jgi:hypothetical protein
MNSYQTNIIWLGLILIALNLIVHIGEVKSVIFNGATGSGSSPGSSGNVLAPGPLNQQTPSGTIV